MEGPHPLESLLQLQLASDSSAALHLPYVLESIVPEYFTSSPQIQKWSSRVQSLLHSKDSSARWSGLCLALRTAMCSKPLMMENAQSWVVITMPLLSKDDNMPILKAAIRLLRYVFSGATDVGEFQRQICMPNVPKFSAALISITERRSEDELKVLVLATLTHLIPLYPSLHRSLHTSVASLSLKLLNGAPVKPTPGPIVEAASRLYSTLHVIGGKVAAVNLWRKSLDDTLNFAWGALANIRRTFLHSGNGSQSQPQNEDPLILIPFSVDRLRAAVRILCDLMRSSTSRPVMQPIGPLVQFCLALLKSTSEAKADGHLDSTVRAMELSAIPTTWALACDLLVALVGSTRCHLTPHVPQILSLLSYHMEQPRTPSQRLSFLMATSAILSRCSNLCDNVLSSRLARAMIPSLTTLLATKAQAQEAAQVEANLNKAKGKKGKKGARAFGDEIFKVAMEVVCRTSDEGEVLLVTLDALQSLLRNAQLSPATYSITARVLLAIHATLPLIQPSVISPDLSLHHRLSNKLRAICTELATVMTSALSKSIGIIIGTMAPDHHDTCGAKTLHELDLLLHPRVPPLVRSLPHVETLSLFPAEEGEEELIVRRSLRLHTADEMHPTERAGQSATPPVLDSKRPEDMITGIQSSLTGPTSPSGPRIEQGTSQFTSSQYSVRHPIVQPPPTPMQSTNSSSLALTITPSPISDPNPSSAALPLNQEWLACPVLRESTTTSAVQASRSNFVADAPATRAAQTTPTAFSASTMSSLTVPVEEDEDEPMPTINMDSDSDG